MTPLVFRAFPNYRLVRAIALSRRNEICRDIQLHQLSEKTLGADESRQIDKQDGFGRVCKALPAKEASGALDIFLRPTAWHIGVDLRPVKRWREAGRAMHLPLRF